MPLATTLGWVLLGLLVAGLVAWALHRLHRPGRWGQGSGLWVGLAVAVLVLLVWTRAPNHPRFDSESSADSWERAGQGVRDGLAHALPPGTPLKKADAYLTANKIDHSTAGKEIRAVIRTPSDLLGAGESLMLTVAFDGNDRLTGISSHVVHEEPTPLPMH